MILVLFNTFKVVKTLKAKPLFLLIASLIVIPIFFKNFEKFAAGSLSRENCFVVSVLFNIFKVAKIETPKS